MKSLSKIFVTVFALFLAVSSSYAQDYNVESSKYMIAGMEALDNNDYETAFNNFSKELEDNPKSIPALCLISRCYMNLYGDFEEALRCANKAIEIAKNKKQTIIYGQELTPQGAMFIIHSENSTKP